MNKEIKKEFERVWQAILELGGARHDKISSPAKKKSSSKVSISDLVLSLKEEGFFDTPRSLKEIQNKLASKTYHYPITSLTDPIKRLVRSGKLGRIKKEGSWHYAKR